MNATLPGDYKISPSPPPPVVCPQSPPSPPPTAAGIRSMSSTLSRVDPHLRVNRIWPCAETGLRRSQPLLRPSRTIRRKLGRTERLSPNTYCRTASVCRMNIHIYIQWSTGMCGQVISRSLFRLNGQTDCRIRSRRPTKQNQLTKARMTLQ